MKYLAIALIYLGYMVLIGMVCWITKSPWPLLALLIVPRVKA